jgi:hypothetical protein
MPGSFNGCGTRFYGNREIGEDGSYVTTEWITFVYIPLIPIRSFRILPQAGGTNVIVYSSQNYLSRRVPLCWPQVRNVYGFTGPILALIVFFSWSDITAWVKSDVLRIRPQLHAQTIPSEPPLDATQSAVACGSVLKLEPPTFNKLNLNERIAALEKQANFTADEAKFSSADDLDQEAFSAYALGFLTWAKPVESVRGDLDKKMVAQINELGSKYSGQNLAVINAFGDKYRGMLLTAFDMGRGDARTSPCPS